MKNFSGIAFKGTFRSYQSAILEKADRYMEDGHIHIVAAPGSGKTILGLELIRRLGNPALILAPTLTIRQQWGERFQDAFLPQGEVLGDYFSSRADKPGLMTCLTYQALFSAMHGIEEESNTRIDLPALLREAGITTLCLDEAHHLRNEWYQSIIDLKDKAGISFQIIALTATPPYDSTPVEWKKYISLCGEIDAEITVPELVKQKTLCPHQDFVYFSRPTGAENQLILAYKNKAFQAVEEMKQRHLMGRALEAAEGMSGTDDIFYEDPLKARAFLFAAKEEGCAIPGKYRSFLSEREGELTRKKGIFQNKLVPEELACQFVLDHPDCFTEEIADAVRSVLQRNGLMERRRVCLTSNAELKKLLASSMGKLEGIQAIVQSEKSVMGSRLRMVILTDYIRKEFISQIGGREEITKMGAVPIFEMLRRSVPDDRYLGVLSGSVVILPDQTRKSAEKLAELAGCHVSFTPLSQTGYSNVSFSGGNKEKVSIVTELLRTGTIRVLIGTAALLGEGWDSPCINSLILASFVGSFMLSNQMRGRAIRIDPDHPEKVSCIWHLITPDFSSLDMGEDFASVSRRFDCFLAPDFREDKIRSGIDRLGISLEMKEKDLDPFNQVMLRASGRREEIRARWEKSLAQCRDGNIEVCQRNEVRENLLPKSFCYINAVACWFVAFLMEFLNYLLIRYGFMQIQILGISAWKICLFLVLSFLIFNFGGREALRFLSPRKLIGEMAEAVFLAMKDVQLITSEDARVVTTGDEEGICISCILKGGTLREKEIFAEAVSEMLSPMNSPRYVILRPTLIGRKGRCSFACPSVLGKSGDRAVCLEKRLRQKIGHCRVFYTRNEEGHRLYKTCVKRSFINYQYDFLVRCLRRQEVY